MSDVERFGFYVIQEGVTDAKTEFVRASDYEALQSRCEAAERDARRYRWLRPRLFSTDWNYGEPPVSVITFRFPDVPVGVGDNLDAAIDTAIKEAGHE